MRGARYAWCCWLDALAQCAWVGTAKWKRQLEAPRARHDTIVSMWSAGGARVNGLVGGVKNGHTHAVTAFNDLRASGVLEFNGT